MTNTEIATVECAKKYAVVWPWVIPHKTNRAYIPKKSKAGYPHISFRSRKLGITQKVEVHRVIAYQIWGDLIFSKGTHVRHLNNDKSDFSVKNLALGTALQNFLDNPPLIREAMHELCISNGRKLRKMSKEDIHMIFEMRSLGASFRQIAKTLGVSKTSVFMAHRGATYGELIRQGPDAAC